MATYQKMLLVDFLLKKKCFGSCCSQGALSGFIVGLSLIFWVILGTTFYPPVASAPPLSIDECVANATAQMATTAAIESTSAVDAPIIER